MAKNQTTKPSKLLEDEDYNEEDAQLFAKLLEERETQAQAGTVASLASGNVLKGTIVEITKDFVVIDVGLKSESFIPIEELTTDEIVLGNEIEVFLEREEDEHGQLTLSREKARKMRRWEYLVEQCPEGSVVEGKILRKVKGGLIVDLDGMDAFLPGSQIDSKRIKNLDDYIGETFDVKILKINVDRKNIVVSRREILENERISRKSEILEDIKEGDIRKGVVKNITDFGVFIDLDGLDGLLHITDMTWKRIKHPSELVALGDKLDVIILEIDREKGRVALGLKQKESNPWEAIEDKYPPGTRVSGKIVNLMNYGAFIELEPGIEGLIHVSEMSWVKNITDPAQIVNKGDVVEAIVLSVQKDEGKISLGMKQTEQNPWDTVEEKYPVGKKVSVEIRNLTNYGAFVQLEPGIDGLIHISDLSWIKKVSHPSEILQKGDVVDAEILSVDKESKKITLGVKQLTENPWDTVEKVLPIGSLVNGTVKKITAFGAFVELDNGMEGLIHVSELSEKPFGKVEEVVSVGSIVQTKVLMIDREHKRVSLSLKAGSQEDTQADEIIVGEYTEEEKGESDSQEKEEESSETEEEKPEDKKA